MTTTILKTVAICNIHGFVDDDGQEVVGWQGTPGHAMVAALPTVYDGELGGLFIWASNDEREALLNGDAFTRAVARRMGRGPGSRSWRTIGDLVHLEEETSERLSEFCMVRLEQDLRQERTTH